MMHTTETPFSGGLARSLALDVLRAIACLLVVASHLALPASSNAFVVVLARGGWIGVDLFFVLSGFLVSGILFREYLANGKVDLSRFLLRRGLRIYPAFYLFLTLTSIAVFVLAKDRSNIAPSHLFAEICFVQNYFTGIWGHTWSLAVEEHFYIGIVLIVFVITKCRWNLGRAPIPIVVGVMAVIALLLRISKINEPFSGPTHRFPTHLRMDSLGFGVFISYLWHFHNEPLRRLCFPCRWLLLFVGCVLTAPAFVWSKSLPLMFTVGVTGFYLGAGAILLAVLFTGIRRNRFTSTIALIGAQSYSIYLWHAPVVTWLLPRISPRFEAIHPWAPPVVGMAVTLAVGIALARIVEVPVLRFRDRFFPSIETRVPTKPSALPVPALATPVTLR